MNFAYSYVRFSRSEQIKGNSLERQLENSREYAAKHGLVLDNELVCTDLGVSAFKGKNFQPGTALHAFLQAISTGKVTAGSTLLVESLDRLSRDDVLDAQARFLDILRAGIRIVTLIDGMVYSRESLKGNSMPLMMSLLKFQLANEESEKKSFRSTANWQKAIKNHETHIATAQCPGWLRPNGDRSGFDIIPERATIVKDIINLAIEGRGVGSIVRYLNEKRTPAFRSKQGWHSGTVQMYLHDRRLLGEWTPKIDGIAGKTIKNYFPPLIDNEKFNALQAALKRRRKGGGRPPGNGEANLFQGLCKCGCCYGSVVLFTQQKNYMTKKFGERRFRKRHYMCYNGSRNRGCKWHQWTAEWLETAFLNSVKAFDFSKISKKSFPNLEKAKLRRLAIETEYATNESAIENVLTAIKKGGDETGLLQSEIKELHATKIKMDSEVKSLEIEIAQLIRDQQSLGDDFAKLIASTESRMQLKEEIRSRIKWIALMYGWGDTYVKDANIIMVKLRNGSLMILAIRRDDPKHLEMAWEYDAQKGFEMVRMFYNSCGQVSPAKMKDFDTPLARAIVLDHMLRIDSGGPVPFFT